MFLLALAIVCNGKIVQRYIGCFLPTSPELHYPGAHEHEISAADSILSAVMLAGCSTSSNLMPEIYLTELSYQQSGSSFRVPSALNETLNSTYASISNTTALRVRTGYWGLCTRNTDASWLCSNRIQDLSRVYQSNVDPLNLIEISGTFKDGVFFPGLMCVLDFSSP